MKKRNEESAATAKAMYAEPGATHAKLAAHFEVSQTTIRQWIDPDYYQRHALSAVRWQKVNAPVVNARAVIRRQNITDEQRDQRNAKQRTRYLNDPKVKETMSRLAAKYRNTPQGILSGKVRLATLAHCDRYPPLFRAFMEAATGMSRREFTIKMEGEGEIDHIIPLAAFDLTNPAHLLRAVHPSNVQLLDKKLNQRKHDAVPDGLDVMALPAIETEGSVTLAQSFILRQLGNLSKSAVDAKPINAVESAHDSATDSHTP